MPSPFPGMDPFIESQCWTDFHANYLSALHAALNAGLRPKYVARSEERVYLERHGDPDDPYFRPDLLVALRPNAESLTTRGVGVTVAEPEFFEAPMAHEIRETFLTVRRLPGHELVAVVELLSPANKRRGSDGQRLYLERRMELLGTRTHLVEIDLLRAGDRLPTRPSLPATDYCAMISPGGRRPRTLVYRWRLRQPMPTIAVPLVDPDPDFALDLQAAFAGMYDRAGYDYSLDRTTTQFDPPLTDADADWLRETIAAA